MRGNSHVRFLGGGTAVTLSCYPTMGLRDSFEIFADHQRRGGTFAGGRDGVFGRAMASKRSLDDLTPPVRAGAVQPAGRHSACQDPAQRL
jgi:hypothetical protein